VVQTNNVERFPNLETSDINVLFSILPLTASAYRSCLIELDSVKKQIKVKDSHE
jgi:hypothetical protein